jgi:hypothetical protein
VGLGVVVLVVLVVLAQPNRAWQDAAEHSKRFWFTWALTFVTIGLVPALVAGEVPEAWSWALIWLLVCCAGAVLQPALLVDVRETRRRRAALRERSPIPTREPAPIPLLGKASRVAEIRWYAPHESAPGHTRIGTSA